MSKFKNLFIFGTGQLSQLIFNLIKHDKNNGYSVKAFIDNKKKIFLGKKVFSEKDFFKVIKKKLNVVIAIGDVKIREKILKKLNKKNIFFPVINFSNTEIYNSKSIGKGTIILPSATILPSSIIGKFCIIGTGVKILHHVKIGSNCVLGGGTLVGSNVKLDDNVSVGVGSVFASKKILIGKYSVICAGSVVLKDVKKFQKVLGNPARLIL